MNVVGIVAEYNPFHMGHRYHLEETRRLAGENPVIIVVMSGNFIQRGGPAVYEKFARARAAAMCGADLVIELPVFWSMAAAPDFARGAVFLLTQLGADTISFGSESGDSEQICRIAEVLSRTETDTIIIEKLKTGISYAAAREQAVARICGAGSELLRSPNDNLAVEYMLAAGKPGKQIEPLAIKRIGEGHNSSKTGEMPSAGALRELLRSGENIDMFLPKPEIFSEQAKAGRGPVFPEMLEQAVLARLYEWNEWNFGEASDELTGESLGLRNALSKSIRNCTSVNEIIESLTGKRYTRARARRLVWDTVLGLPEDIRKQNPAYARILACTKRGRELLHEANTTIPVLTKPADVISIGKNAERQFKYGACAEDFYALAWSRENRLPGADWRSTPIILP